MKEDEGAEPRSGASGGGVRGFLVSFLTAVARDFLQLLMAFALGTGGAAIVCWYYGVPLLFSILGGILVLGLAVALKTDSLFD